MKTIEIVQKSLLNATEQYLNARQTLIYYLRQAGHKKASALLGKLHDKFFWAKELIAEDDWHTKYFKDCLLKVVAVNYNVSDYRLDRILSEGDYNDAVGITVFFLRDPNEILSSGVNLTEKETQLLKKLQRLYDYKDRELLTSDDVRKYEIIDDELNDLKHRYHMILRLQWSYSLEDITADDYLERGIKAKVGLC